MNEILDAVNAGVAKPYTASTDRLCLECDREMWREGWIGDDMLLCHACYDNDNLNKHYPKEGK